MPTNYTSHLHSTEISGPQALHAPKVLLVVCLYENNFGDILIYQTIDNALKRAGYLTEIIHVHQSIEESGFISRANVSDFLFFVGGGLIEKWAPPIIKLFDKIQPLLSTPYGIVGLSTGNFDYSRYHAAFKAFADNAYFFVTRDSESITTFERADASCLPLAGVDVVFANDEIASYRPSSDAVKASFRNMPYPDISGDLNWLAWSAALKNIGVTSLIQDCSPAQNALQISISQGDILTEISNSRIIVSMRYHIIVAAAMMGVLPIPISYCPKVKRLAQQLGISQFCLEPNEHYKLEVTYKNILTDYSMVSKRLMARVYQLRTMAHAIIHHSTKLVEIAVNEKKCKSKF